MVDYDRTRLPEVYRQGRALSDDALARWEAALAGLLPLGPAVTRVVDVGCGTARFVPLLGRLFGAPVVGVDPSLRMLAEREAPGGGFVAGHAEAIPLADGSVDLAFLSMIYHHIDPAAALPELRRIVRPGGHAIVRTATLEGLEAAVEYLRFFPEALATNRARMPRRAAIVEAFAAHGFARREHRVIPTPLAASRAEYCRKIAHRGFSSLQLMPDDAFARGLAALERYCAAAGADGPIDEQVDLFLFQRAA
jgi:SAM-dependent methyltransferase